MAQKKKKEAEKKEDYEWTPPDFNEREFLEKDIRLTKILLVTAGLAVIFAIVAFALTGYDWLIGFAAIVAGAVALRYIYPFFKIDVKSIEKKTWISNIVLFMFMALGIWILLLNPPFSDHTIPGVGDAQILVNENGTWTKLTSTNANTLINANETVNITVTASDISGIEKVEISTYLTGQQAGAWQLMSEGSDNQYSFIDTYEPGTYFYLVKATDSNGHTYQTSAVQFIVNA